MEGFLGILFIQSWLFVSPGNSFESPEECHDGVGVGVGKTDAEHSRVRLEGDRIEDPAFRVVWSVGQYAGD